MKQIPFNEYPSIGWQPISIFSLIKQWFIDLWNEPIEAN